jgi:hypothetical protein
MKIPVGFSELEKAFRLHSNNSQNKSDFSHSLLLFYSVECGLKSLFLKKKKLKTTDQMASIIYFDSHDLIGWAQVLKIPAYVSKTNVIFHLRRDGNKWPLKTAHQAWRYGALIKESDETDLILLLNDFKKWIEQEMGL